MKASRVFDYAIWATLGVGVLALVARKGSGPEEGTVARAIDLPLVGKAGRFRLEDHRGKPVVLEVFASWCGACRRATPALSDAFREYRDRVTFVGVSVDESAEEALAAKESWGVPFDVALDDGSLSRDYEVTRYPTLVVIGSDGVVEHVSSGAPSRSDIERWLSD